MPEETPPAGAPPETPPTSDPLAELKGIIAAQNEQITGQGKQLAALNDVIKATLAGRNVNPGSGGPTGRVTPQLRDALRNRGLSDADISHNAEIILPFIEVFAPELISLVEGRVAPISEAVSLAEMVEDTEQYPDAKLLRTDIRKLLADAKKDGQPLSPTGAYHTARSLDVSKGTDSKVLKADSARRAESNASDVGALGGVGHRASSSQSARAPKSQGPRTAEDLSKLSYDDRMKFYAEHGDVPIQ